MRRLSIIKFEELARYRVQEARETYNQLNLGRKARHHLPPRSQPLLRFLHAITCKNWLSIWNG